MNILNVSCGCCAGIGKITEWKIVDTKDNIGTAVREETACTACDGKGYIEYAMFTPEEAKAILKHCGLS